MKRTTRRLILWLLIFAGALISAVLVAGLPQLAIAIPVSLVGAAAAIRHPTPFVLGLLLLSSTFGSLAAFTGFQQWGTVIDLLIIMLLCAAVMGFVSGRRERSFWIWPGVLALALYIGLTFCEILTSPDPAAGVDSFRTMTLLMMIVLVIAYSGWTPERFDQMAKGVVVVGLLIGGYATLRWAIGPATSEVTHAVTTNGGFVSDLNGRLFQFGSFGDQHQLGLWTATAAPFCAALGFSMAGRWRLAAFAASGLLIVGLLGSEVRSALVAIVAAMAVVVILFQLCRSYRGLHLGTTFLVTILVAGTGTALYLLTVGPSGTARYSKIFHPSSDQAYQQRQGKWGEALRDIHKHPFGQGLGTAGVTNEQFGRYYTIANAQFDNSFLVVAWQQGFAVMIFFGLALALLASDLARHAIRTLDPQRAAIALGSVGTMTALAVMLYFGSYLDAVSIVGPWVLIGLGVAQFSTFEPIRSDKRREPTAAAARPPAAAVTS